MSDNAFIFANGFLTGVTFSLSAAGVLILSNWTTGAPLNTLATIAMLAPSVMIVCWITFKLWRAS